MSTRTRATTIILCITAAILLSAAWTPASNDDDELRDSLKAMARRIGSLEKTLGSQDSANSTPSIVGRVARLEKALGELSRAAGRPKWASPNSNIRELRRTIETAQRHRGQLGKRLDRLEHDLRDTSDSARKLRDMKSALDKVRSDISNLERRIQRLESKH